MCKSYDLTGISHTVSVIDTAVALGDRFLAPRYLGKSILQVKLA